MIDRTAASVLRRLLVGYPIVTVTGPRQSGKTTLVRDVLNDRPYVSLEDPDQRNFALEDPRGFLANFPDGAILDEVQRAPELLSYLQTLVDLDGRMGRFVLTGSNQFHLLSRAAQSLAGRTGLVRLLPFTLGELQAAKMAPQSLEELLVRGLFPALYDRPLEAHTWYADYVSTYVERDVRQMVNVSDLGRFDRFLRMCAGRSGQLLNLSSLATDAGVTHNTARSWIGVLEASYLVHLVAPYHANLGKRLIKTPKLYFTDPGLVAWLLGVETPDQLRFHAARGALFETWVISELLKGRYNIGRTSNLSFWRDRAGAEVDVLLEMAGRVVQVEIKAGRTVAGDALASLLKWRHLAGNLADEAFLVYGGTDTFLRSGCRVVPWSMVGDVRVSGRP